MKIEASEAALLPTDEVQSRTAPISLSLDPKVAYEALV